MPLFHPRVLEKYAQHIPVNPQHLEILTRWAENVRRGVFDVETQSDARFIQRILIDVLGYVGRGDDPNWTLSKNQPVGSGNVDVALGNFTAGSIQILAPLELKGAKTKNLDALYGNKRSPVQQAWDYATDNEGTKWVLVSNYGEIRLYAYGKGRKNYESFDLTALADSERQYKRFILLLSAQNLLGGKTLSLLNESEQTDKDITDKFYREYKEFRVRLIESISGDNPEKSRLDIIRHSQKILDRILFVAFAESRELLPKKTLQDVFASVSRYNPQPIWKNFVGLFNAINEGSDQLGITAYNGGLFADDPDLNDLVVRDELCEGFRKIGEYDFDTEISVEILGHIFEQSIGDLEELRAFAERADGAVDKKKSKRKADGVFYTPSYITQYIVEQTVGGWLGDKRREIGFDALPILSDDDYDMNLGARLGKKERIALHIKAWESYKEALSQIKVVDPACGSGAFLIEVFDYLRREGKKINDELTRLQGGQQSIFRWDTHILRNNLYGVDLNRESVEITKLSLWLKTANSGEKLTYLEDNIKVGNSLIDDKSVAGDLAFDWNEQFPDIMASGGFDIVVGNPPYVFAREKINDVEKEYYAKKYESARYQVNTYILFMEKFFLLSRKNGRCGLIVPNSWLMVYSGEDIRRFMMRNTTLCQIVNLYGKSFEEANVETVITIAQNSPCDSDHETLILKNDETASAFLQLHAKRQLDFNKNKGVEFDVFADAESTGIINKLRNGSRNLDEVCSVKAALKAYEKGKGIPAQTAEDVKNRPYDFNYRHNQDTHKYLEGMDVLRYGIVWSGSWLWYGSHLAAPRTFDLFSNERIVVREITGKYPRCIIATYTDEIYLFNTSNIAVIKREDSDIALKYVAALLNSSLLSYYFVKKTAKAERKLFPKIILNDLRLFPIKDIAPERQQPFIVHTDKMLSLNADMSARRVRFQNLLSDNLNGAKISDKRFDDLVDFRDFLDELKKQKRSIPHGEQEEWRETFLGIKRKIASLREEIRQTDAEIDRMTYELYELNEEEIAIVEGIVNLTDRPEKESTP